MEIRQGGIGAHLSAQRELWGLVKAQRASQAERQEAQAYVEQALGNLLLGQDLTPAQHGDYVRRLAGTAAQASKFGKGPEVRDVRRAIVPRELLLLKAGGVPWRPFAVSKRAVQVTPLHRRLQDRMALALRDKMMGDSQSARTCVHSVAFTVKRGHGAVEWSDEDRVELSGFGLEIQALEAKMKATPRLPAPHFLFETVAPISGLTTASSNR